MYSQELSVLRQKTNQSKAKTTKQACFDSGKQHFFLLFNEMNIFHKHSRSEQRANFHSKLFKGKCSEQSKQP